MTDFAAPINLPTLPVPTKAGQLLQATGTRSVVWRDRLVWDAAGSAWGGPYWHFDVSHSSGPGNSYAIYDTQNLPIGDGSLVPIYVPERSFVEYAYQLTATDGANAKVLTGTIVYRRRPSEGIYPVGLQNVVAFNEDDFAGAVTLSLLSGAAYVPRIYAESSGGVDATIRLQLRVNYVTPISEDP